MQHLGQSLRIIVLTCCLALARCKLHSGVVHIAEHAEGQWKYVGKFGYAIGLGTYDIRLRLQPTDHFVIPQVDLDVFLDEEWDAARLLPACSRAWDGPSRIKHHRLVVGTGGEWGPWQSSTVHQVIRPHIWYFSLSDCYGLNHRSPYSFEYEIRWRQHDGSELSFEVLLAPLLEPLWLLVMTALLGLVGSRCWKAWQRSGALHPMAKGLAATAVLQWLAQLARVLHTSAASQTGVHLPLLLDLAVLHSTASQVSGSLLLLAISRGYTVMPGRQDEWKHWPCVSAGVLLLHLSLAGLGRWQGETADTHHEHAGFLGSLLLVLRIVLYADFAYKVRALRQRGGPRLAAFLGTFVVAGSSYLLAFPITWLVAQAFAPYLQHLVLHLGLLTIQACAALWLADLFLSQKSSYYVVSELSCSLLPGGTSGPFRGKED